MKLTFALQLLAKHLIHYIKKKKDNAILKNKDKVNLNKLQLLFLLTRK